MFGGLFLQNLDPATAARQADYAIDEFHDDARKTMRKLCHQARINENEQMMAIAWQTFMELGAKDAADYIARIKYDDGINARLHAFLPGYVEKVMALADLVAQNNAFCVERAKKNEAYLEETKGKKRRVRDEDDKPLRITKKRMEKLIRA